MGDKVDPICPSVTFVNISYIPHANKYEMNKAGCPEQMIFTLNSTFFYPNLLLLASLTLSICFQQ